MANDNIEMRDQSAIDEEHMMYGHGPMTEQELDGKYPNRPHNHAKTLPFRVLFEELFNPLNDNKKKPTGPAAMARRKQGPHHANNSPHEIRRSIIDKFISRWRQEVGNDFYPALRLIVPEKDRDRGMYGLKEMTLAKMFIRILKIDKNSDDANKMVQWKGIKSSAVSAGDFAGRCFEVISKRPMRQSPGNMSIAEVNELLDRLSIAQKEENQRPILTEFYNRMNAEELMWLIRMILRQMKVGATEKTLFEIWHPDADNLFNISSSLRRVCWELYDKQVRLEGDSKNISLMQCFQPQLAAFQMRSMEQMVTKMNPTEDDSVFWVEEKLDGERMQLHMMEDDEKPGGKRFGFWSRKAKDYTYLYGNGFEDDNAALTRHIRDAFDDGVRNIILDGEMITWDLKEDAIVGFGTLKTAALEQQQNPYSGGNRPLFRVFDCLYLNDRDLTRYNLRERRKALVGAVKNVHRRLEIHEYTEAQSAAEIEPKLRAVVAEASEGLVLKNPRSAYRLNDRNEDWIKVKPEYMTEFGESLDCVVVGGYYGSGKRGGVISSFLCGLKPHKLIHESARNVEREINPQFTMSFCKVGGGLSAADYAQIRHKTEGKWKDWDPKNPPRDWIQLGGGDRQFERPDVWIKPEDSVVIEIKAASAGGSSQFATGVTLRFPRFKKLRLDKDWTQALTFDEFMDIKTKAEEEHAEKKFKVDESRKSKRATKKRKRETVIQGQENEVKTPYAGPATKVFEGLTFFIMSEAPKPIKKSKAELEQIVKANGGKVVASEKDPKAILIADRNLVKVAAAVKRNERNIIRPGWLLDCIKQNELDGDRPTLLLPIEPQHIFHTMPADERVFNDNVDEYGDSFTRDVTTEDLLTLFKNMPSKIEDDFDDGSYNPSNVLDQFIEHGYQLDAIPEWMFHGLRVYFQHGVSGETIRLLEFAGGITAVSLDDVDLTHVVVMEKSPEIPLIRKTLSSRRRLPRIVSEEWILESWAERTRLDEERFATS